MVDEPIRLQLFLARCGICSRRQAEKHIINGKVCVNNIVITSLGTKISPHSDEVRFENRICKLKEHKVYFLFHKPIYVESTNSTKTQHKTSREYLMPYYKDHLFCVGRLDYMSSGLMIYTNDGTMTHRLTHPRFNIKKVYEVRSSREIPVEILKKWKQGVSIDGQRYLLQEYSYCKDKTHIDKTCVQLILCEGKNREIRTVFSFFNVPIKRLHRTDIGPFSLLINNAYIKSGKVVPADDELIDKIVKNNYNFNSLEEEI